MRIKSSLLCALVATPIWPCAANSTTYTGFMDIGTGSANVTITTNGALGTLAQSDITNWNITVTNGSNNFDLTGPLSGGNSHLNLVGGGLTATQSSLTYQFPPNYNYMLFQGSGSSAFYCMASIQTGCGQYSQSVMSSLNYSSSDVTGNTITTPTVIATSASGGAFEQAVSGAVKIYTPSGGPYGSWDSFTGQYNLQANYTPAMISAFPAGQFLASGIGATFIPNGGLSLQTVAQMGGFDHFNWAQGYSATLGGPPTIDPPEGCYQPLASITGNSCPNRDNLPWYLDEQYTNDGVEVYDASGNLISTNAGLKTKEQAWTYNSDTLLFSDDPAVSDYFVTCLVGVRANGTGSIISPSDCFSWNTAAGNPVFGETEGLGGSSLSPNFGSFLNVGDPQQDTLLLTDLGNVVSPAPEPSSWAIYIVGLAALGTVLRARARPLLKSL